MSPDDSNETTPKLKRQKNKSFLRRTWFGKARSGDVFFVSLFFLVVILVFILQPARIGELIFNKYAGIVLIIMIAEFFMLKSMDRTKVYERECAKLRDKLKNQKRVLRKSRTLLEEATTTNIKDGTDEQVRWDTRAEDCVKEIDML